MSERAHFHVRAAAPRDGDAMRALLPRLASFAVPAYREPEHLWRGDEALLLRWLAGEADGCLVHVAESDRGAVVGLTIVSLGPELLSHEPSAHLEVIVVAAEAEGRGVGAALLENAEAAAREHGARTMTLHVFASNERARGVYRRSGYEGELIRKIKALEGA